MARGWPAHQAGLDRALRGLGRRLLDSGHGAAHQPGVRNMVHFMLSGQLTGSREDIAPRLVDRLQIAEQSILDASRAMARCGAALLEDGSRVLVHDFAEHSTQAVITEAATQGKRLEVIASACRTRRSDGVRVAREARAVGHRATVVTDAGVAWAMAHYGVRTALLGADAVSGDGAVLTTPGGLAIAMAGSASGVPIHVATDLWKFVETLDLHELQAINEAPVTDGVPEAGKWTQDGYGFLNPLVDIVPAGCLTSFITEFGELAPTAVGDAARTTLRPLDRAAP